jgi:hypothetical protein
MNGSSEEYNTNSQGGLERRARQEQGIIKIDSSWFKESERKTGKREGKIV